MGGMRRWLLAGAVAAALATPGIAGAAGRPAESASPAAGAWHSVSAPQPRLKGTFAAVSCPTRHFCMAVGAAGAGGDIPLAETFNGKRWAIEHPPTIRGSAALLAVSCVSATDCTAVGSSDGATTVALGWNGSKWRVEPTSTKVGADAVLQAVDCTTTSMCMAVGTAGYESLAERWQAGTGWSVVSTAHLADNFILYGVACPSRQDCVGVGNFDANDATTAGAATWTGSAWHKEKVPPVAGSALQSVSCPSARVCVAVGGNGSPAFIERDGKWTALPHTPVGTLNGVACRSARACLVVGEREGTDTIGAILVERWNGRAWSLVSSPQPHPRDGGVLAAVSCTSAGRCVAPANLGDEGPSPIFVEAGPLS